MEDKRIQDAEGAHSSEPHLIGEFVVVMKNGGCTLLCLDSMLVTVIGE